MEYKPFIVVDGIRHPYSKKTITRDEVLKLANKTDKTNVRVYYRDYNGLNAGLMEKNEVLKNVKQNRFNTLQM